MLTIANSKMMVQNEIAVEKHETVQENMSKDFAYEGDMDISVQVKVNFFLHLHACMSVASSQKLNLKVTNRLLDYEFKAKIVN